MKKTMMILAATLLSACSHTSKKSSDITTAVKTRELPLIGETAAAWGADAWISVGHDGVRLSGSATPAYAHAAEYLDVRRNPDEGASSAALTLDSANRPVLVAGGERNAVYVGKPLDYGVEGVCLYQPAGQALQAFVLADDGLARHLVFTTDKTQLQWQLLRTLALPVGTEYCAVDDARDILYLSEEGVGVWMLNARAESEPVRRAVDWVEPVGTIAVNAGPLAAAEGQLWLAEKEHNRIHHYRLSNGAVQKAAIYTLGNFVKIDTLTASVSADGTVELVLFDEHNEQLHSVSTAFMPIDAAAPIKNIAAVAQTEPVASVGDAADDPALWVHPQDKSQSLILGTNKQAGLNVYTLDGALVQSIAAGRVNNVDVRQGFSWRGQPMDIAAASQRDNHAIALFTINPKTGKLTPVGEVVTTLDDVYGLCMYRGEDKKVYVFINDEDGRYEQYLITDSNHGWSGKKVREFAVASQPEGCSPNEQTNELFVGEEGEGIWVLPAKPDAKPALKSVAKVSDTLVADVEGMEVIYDARGAMLVVSSQGNDSYLLYQATAPYQYLGRFRVGMNLQRGIDGASETDGLTAVAGDFGADYPQGILVVQDGRNLMPAANQNYKMVSWADVLELLDQ